jgi:hypothetical protein
MTLRLRHPKALEPARAAAYEARRRARSPHITKAQKRLEEETTAALRRSMGARDG